MFKNQLQELAQRSCFNLPCYGCSREGPDHAPRFKACVNFNGEIFESPNYCTTLRQAEHSAAEVALNVLSSRGPSKSLTARVLDETGIYKNLLQETAHRAGLKLPVYTTVRSGPGHAPIFTCTVELAAMNFNGEPAKTKKQAEKNAAIAAWCSLKKFPEMGSLLNKESSSRPEEQDQVAVAKLLSNFRPKDHNQNQQAKKRMVRGHREVSFGHQKWKILDLLNVQRQQNSFVSLLPPPPPPTASKILSLTNPQNRPEIELEKETSSSSIYMPFSPRAKTHMNPSPTPPELEKETLSSYMPFPLRDKTQMGNSVIRSTNQNLSPIPLEKETSSSSIYMSFSPRDKTQMANSVIRSPLELEKDSIYMSFSPRGKTQMATSVVRSTNQNPPPIPPPEIALKQALEELEKEASSSSSSIYMPFSPRSTNHNPPPIPPPEIALKHALEELEKEASSSSSCSSINMPFSPRAKTQMANRAIRSTSQNPSPIPPPETALKHALEELEKEASSSSSSIYMSFPLRDKIQMANRAIRSTNQNPSPNPPQGFNFNYNFKNYPQRRNVPAVQIRSVIPVCAAPNPPPSKLKEISASALIATEVPINNKPLLQQQQSSLPPHSELSSCDEFNTKLQL